MGEYASITAAITIFVTSLTGVYATGLTASTTKTAALVSAIARSRNVPAPKARAAYAAAPYSKPALRYLYAVGWVGSASNLATCKAAQVLGPVRAWQPPRRSRARRRRYRSYERHTSPLVRRLRPWVAARPTAAADDLPTTGMPLYPARGMAAGKLR